MASILNPILANISSIPTVIPLTNTTSLSMPLDETSVFHGLQGTHYSNNHFSGDTTPYSLSTELSNTINLGAYESFDIQGYLQVDTAGDYTFQIEYTQRGQLDINGASIGSLETWNIGMCWLTTSTDNTNPMTLHANTFYPIRLRYQSGCGGGHITVRLCLSGVCNNINPLMISSTNNDNQDVPVLITSTFLALAFNSAFYSTTNQQEAPCYPQFPHHQIPDDGSVTTGMVGIAFDEFLLNTLFSTIASQGIFQATFTDADIPPNFPIHLNTTSFAQFIPDINDK